MLAWTAAASHNGGLTMAEYFNVLDFGQMLMWHIVLLPAALGVLVVWHVLLVRRRGVVPPIPLDTEQSPAAELDEEAAS